MPPDTIILLNFPPAPGFSYSEKGNVYPCTASMLIGKYPKRNGYSVHIIDGAYHEDYLVRLRDMLMNHPVLYVGMTVMTTQVPFALAASAVVKSIDRKIPVVWGGPHPTLFPESTLEHADIDIVVINEGTNTSRELADYFCRGGDIRQINGIGYKNGLGGILFTPPRDLEDISDLPYFDFSLIDVDNYLSCNAESVYQREFPGFLDKVRIMPILTALGCPYRCRFCINVILKRRYRSRSAASVVAEIRRLMKEYGVNTFLFLDEDFFVNKKRVLEFTDLVIREGLHFNWRMWCRVDHFSDTYINRSLIETLSAIGHGSLVMGAESASQEMLDALDKEITVGQINRSLDVIRGSPITPRYSFMVGLPGETLSQIKKTYRLCLAMTAADPSVDIAGPFVFRLYPGSPMFDEVVAKYRLAIPRTPEAWAEYVQQETTFTPLPWAPVEFNRDLPLILFYSGFAFEKIQRTMPPRKKVFHRVLRALSRLRIRTFFFYLPFEYHAVMWLQKRS